MSKKSFYFTFGTNHKDKQGRSLFKKFTIIDATTADEARSIMFQARGAKWAFMYTNEWQAGIERHGLEYVEFDDLRIQNIKPIDITNSLFI